MPLLAVAAMEEGAASTVRGSSRRVCACRHCFEFFVPLVCRRNGLTSGEAAAEAAAVAVPAEPASALVESVTDGGRREGLTWGDAASDAAAVAGPTEPASALVESVTDGAMKESPA